MDNTQLIEKRRASAETIAKKFEAMAERIRRNGDDNFGGAFLLIPPDNAGKAIEVMSVADTNPAHFWLLVKAGVDEQYQEIQALSARQRSFG